MSVIRKIFLSIFIMFVLVGGSTVADYTAAASNKKQQAEAYLKQGDAYDKKGQYDRVSRDHTRAIQLNPRLAVAYYNRGVAYSKQGWYDRAIRDFTQVIKLNPKDAAAYNNRGALYINMPGNRAKGCADYKKACELGMCGDYNKARQRGDC